MTWSLWFLLTGSENLGDWIKALDTWVPFPIWKPCLGPGFLFGKTMQQWLPSASPLMFFVLCLSQVSP